MNYFPWQRIEYRNQQVSSCSVYLLEAFLTVDSHSCFLLRNPSIREPSPPGLGRSAEPGHGVRRDTAGLRPHRHEMPPNAAEKPTDRRLSKISSKTQIGTR